MKVQVDLHSYLQGGENKNQQLIKAYHIVLISLPHVPEGFVEKVG
jgi:hypothetical protein